jgi:hypothetical protein
VDRQILHGFGVDPGTLLVPGSQLGVLTLLVDLAVPIGREESLVIMVWEI